MRYLVTGGAGFIGSSLVYALLENGHDVTVFDRMSRGTMRRLQRAKTLPGSMIVIQDDIRDEEAVRAAARGCDSVVHLAYLQGTQTFYSDPAEVLEVAAAGMLNVLNACEHYDIRDFLLLSSSEAYQVASIVPTPEHIPLYVPDVLNPRFSYGGGKIFCELLLNAWVVKDKLDRGVIARPHNVYGPDMGKDHVIPEFCLRMSNLVQTFPEGVIEFPIQGTGQETRSFCYIDDCVRQLDALLKYAPDGASVWHVGTEDERTIHEVADEVAYWYDRSVKVIPGKLPEGSPPRRLPDTSKIRALHPACEPQVAFNDGVAETVSWYRNYG
jgi:nucleoside-diphosphate-sugar epimerase